MSRRIPVAQADQLCADVEQYHRFEKLAKEFAEITIAMTRAACVPDAKKKALTLLPDLLGEAASFARVQVVQGLLSHHS